MAERRQRILAAARAIVAARGYEALTMRELAQASRVTVPTLYNLIGGKEAVLFAAVEEQTARFVARIERGSGRPAAQLLAVIDACVRELLALPAYYRTLLHLLYTSDGAARVRRSVDRALAGELLHALGAIAEAGELAPWADPRALLRTLRAHLGATALEWASGALPDAAFPAAAAYEACLTLLGVTQGGSRAEFERAARAFQPAAFVPPRRRRARAEA
jgi:AcrR family transcriptional regulator